MLNAGSAEAPADCRTWPAVAVGPTFDRVLEVEPPTINAWFVTGVPFQTPPEVIPWMPAVCALIAFAIAILSRSC